MSRMFSLVQRGLVGLVLLAVAARLITWLLAPVLVWLVVALVLVSLLPRLLMPHRRL